MREDFVTFDLINSVPCCIVKNQDRVKQTFVLALVLLMPFSSLSLCLFKKTSISLPVGVKNEFKHV